MTKQIHYSDPMLSASVARPAAPSHGLLERIYRRKFLSADIVIGGHREWDMQVHDRRLYRRLLLHGSLGLGESYVEGWWDAPRLDMYFERLMSAELDEKVVNFSRMFAVAKSCLRNLQSLGRAAQVGKLHYDLGNDFYRDMLGGELVYTCAYWRNASDLDTAQRHKLDLVCRKLHLEPGMRVLDIGCGWGSFARFAAQRYGVEVVGVTISAEQTHYARAHCTGMPVDIRLADYRAVDEQFDRIVSLGMFEHVGHKNYAVYMDGVRRNLSQDGLFLLHSIGRNERGTGIDPWVTKNIFPNSEVPSLRRLSDAISGRLILEDLENFGTDYDRTLMAWFANFERAWPRYEQAMPRHFYRLWKYYLLMFAGVFRARGLQLWQLVLAPKIADHRYHRPLG